MQDRHTAAATLALLLPLCSILPVLPIWRSWLVWQKYIIVGLLCLDLKVKKEKITIIPKTVQ